MGLFNCKESKVIRPKIKELKNMKLGMKDEEDNKVNLPNDSGLDVGEWLLAVDRVTHIPGKCKNQTSTPVYVNETFGTAVPTPSDQELCDLNEISTSLVTADNCDRDFVPLEHANCFCSCDCCTNTTGVYEVAVAIVTWVHKRITTQFPDFKFEIMPTGSFPLDVKVLENSEFDFLLVFTLTGHNEKLFIQSHEVFHFFEKWFAKLQRTEKAKNPTQHPGITAVYKHGPSWCIEMAWQSEHRTNTLSIDITLGVRHVEEPLQSRCSSLNNSLFKDIYNNILDGTIFVNSDRHRAPVALCALDERMFAQIQTVSPNVLPAYRLMKVFVSLLFPKRVKFCKFTARGFTAAPYVTSHELKNLLYREVEQYHNVEDWEVDQLPQRIVGMLKCLLQRECELALQEYIRDENSSREMRTYSWLIEYISRGSSSHQETAQSATEQDDNSQSAVDCKDFFAYVKERDIRAYQA